MPRKGMKSLCFSLADSSSSSTPPISHFSLPSPSRLSFSDSVIDRTLELAAPIIRKWDAETTAYAAVTSLFHQSRREAKDFIKWVNNLQKAMHFVVTENSGSEKLVRAQILMEMAMKRLQKEFYQILSMNRAYLDPESVSARSSRTSTRSSTSGYDYDEVDDLKLADDSISEVEGALSMAMADLKLIAECMISAGYAKECVKIYNIIRKSIVDEGIYRLGVEKFSPSQIHKMKGEVLEVRIKNWLNAIGSAVNTLFKGEKILCDHVFMSSDSIRESSFTEISKDGAMIIFGFPETVAKNSKKSPEKVFHVLDLYTGISLHWREIETIFSFESTSIIKSQAIASLISLGDYARAALIDFESAIQKESSKDIVAGAGIHNRTIEVMDFLCLLADYSNVLPDIIPHSASYSSLESCFADVASPISIKIAGLILVLLRKLDAKSTHYKEPSLAHLFLANNLQHVVVKVRTSNLQYILGDEWILKEEAKVKQFVSDYERLGWSHVVGSLPSDSASMTNSDAMNEIFAKFNSSFVLAYKKQSPCVIRDRNLRDAVKVSLKRMILIPYGELYDTCRLKMEIRALRLTPGEVERCLSDLFIGQVE